MFVTRWVSRATKCSSLLCCYVSVLPITDDSPIYSDEFNFTEKRRRRTRHTLFEKRLNVGGIAYCRHWGDVSCSMGMNTQILVFFSLWCMYYHRILLLSSIFTVIHSLPSLKCNTCHVPASVESGRISILQLYAYIMCK